MPSFQVFSEEKRQDEERVNCERAPPVARRERRAGIENARIYAE